MLCQPLVNIPTYLSVNISSMLPQLWISFWTNNWHVRWQVANNTDIIMKTFISFNLERVKKLSYNTIQCSADITVKQQHLSEGKFTPSKLSKVASVKHCRPTLNFNVPSFHHPSPPNLRPKAPCGPLPALFGSLPDISESFPAPGGFSAPISAAARWQNVFPPFRLIELKVLHIHCCCCWTAVSSEESFCSPSPCFDRTLLLARSKKKRKKSDGIAPQWC